MSHLKHLNMLTPDWPTQNKVIGLCHVHVIQKGPLHFVSTAASFPQILPNQQRFTVSTPAVGPISSEMLVFSFFLSFFVFRSLNCPDLGPQLPILYFCLSLYFLGVSDPDRGVSGTNDITAAALTRLANEKAGFSIRAAHISSAPRVPPQLPN